MILTKCDRIPNNAAPELIATEKSNCSFKNHLFYKLLVILGKKENAICLNKNRLHAVYDYFVQ